MSGFDGAEWMGTFTCANCKETFLLGGSAESDSIEDNGKTYCCADCHMDHSDRRWTQDDEDFALAVEDAGDKARGLVAAQSSADGDAA